MITFSQILGMFDGSSELPIPPNWLQGRTAYGGLSTALALQSALNVAGKDLPPLKSATVSFIGPAAGSLRFRSNLLRRGKTATSIAVDCLADGELALRASFVFAAPRTSSIDHDFCDRPAVGTPKDYKPFNGGGVEPASTVNFDLRPTGGALPLSGSKSPVMAGWVRHVDAVGVEPAVALVALADSMPPAALACLTEMAAFSTVTWTFDLAQPAEAGEWFLLRSCSQRAKGGYSYQTMNAWNEGGQLVLAGSQTVVFFA